MGPIKTQAKGQPFGAHAKDNFRHARKLRGLCLALIGSCNLKVSLAALRDYSRAFYASPVFKPIYLAITGEWKTVSKVEKPVKSKRFTSKATFAKTHTWAKSKNKRNARKMQGHSHTSLVYACNVCEFRGKNLNLVNITYFTELIFFHAAQPLCIYGIGYISLFLARDKSIAQSGGYLFWMNSDISTYADNLRAFHICN